MAGDNLQVNLRPFVTLPQVVHLAKEIFGVEVKNPSSVKELESYQDRNYLIECKNATVENDEAGFSKDDSLLPSKKYVLKLLHPKNTYADGFLEATVQSLEHLQVNKPAAGHLQFPENVRTLAGEFLHLKEFNVPLDYLTGKDDNLYNLIKRKRATGDNVWRVTTDENGEVFIKTKLYIRLLTFVPGMSLLHCTVTDNLLFEVGVLSGVISKELKSFSHPSLIAKKDIWDMKNLLQLNTAKYLDLVQDERKRALLQTGLELFERNFLTIADTLPQQTIHSDINEGNILVSETNNTASVSGLVDFGDLTYSYHVFEVGTAMAYMAMQRPDDCIKSAGIVLSGFLSESSLSVEEKSVLFYTVVSRIVQSLIIGNYTHTLDSGNQYLLSTSTMGFRVLETFLNYRNTVQEIYDIWYKQ